MATVAPIAGRYDLRNLLLDDGVKQSWTAYDRQLDRDVSVELVTSADPEVQRRFLARARLLAAENHPHLVTVYDTGQQGDAPYAVLEPQMQGTLAERLQAGPPFGLTQVVELGIALSVATAAALQRDLDVEPLDPADVLLRDGDHVKLANLLVRPATPPEAVVTSEQPLVTQIAALLVAAMQPPGVGVTPITRAADLPTSLPATLRTIVLAAIAPRGASIRTLAELRQALTDYRGAALSTTRAFAPLTAAHPAEASGAALASAAAMPATRTIPTGGLPRRPPVALGRVHRRGSPWLSIIGLLVVLLLVGGAVAFAEWLGSVDTVAPNVPNVSAAGAATPAPRAIGFPAIFSRPSPTPTSGDTPTASPTVAVVTQGQLGGILETPTAGGAHATETAMAAASATAGVFATETATAGPSTTATPSTPSPTPPTTDTPVATNTPMVTDTPVPPTATPIVTAAVPSVVGQPVAEAVQVLNQAGFSTARAPNQVSTGVPAGAVLAQDPPATSIIPIGSTIRLTVSSGPPASTVPDVVGMASGQAQAAIAQVGLTSKSTSSPSANVPEGNVIAQNPAPGTTMQPGSQVALTVSAGNKVTVPSVIGVPETQAQAAIRAAGLTSTFPNRSGHSPNVQVGQVESQDPRAGTLVAPGTVVYINVRAS
ncbi:MAG TPA: PASTA domain-containing protein [Chloroflexota bacterium]|jgi:serine/threonine-protein kinase|nr:PASTA domain-containing protein [Chloroflexota bacterium]